MMRIIGKAGYSDVLGLKNELYSDSREYRSSKMHLAPYALAAYTALAGCGGNGNGITGPSSPDPPPAGKVTLSGQITNRIAGNNIGNSKITFSGPETKSADIVGGNYQIPDLASGVYDVSIENPSHVKHETKTVTIGASGNFPFSVIQWNSGRDGAVYDQTFDDFFRSFGRNEGNSDSWKGIQKWNFESNPPREIYISLTAPSQYYLDWNPEAVLKFKELLNEVLSESLNGMSCGKVLSIPINEGTSVGTNKSDAIIAAIRPDVTQINDIHKNVNNYVDGEILSLIANKFNDSKNYTNSSRISLKSDLLHELTHAISGAFHSYSGPYPNSIMGGNFITYRNITSLSPQDKLGACIINNNDTKPGNVSPDTNPKY